MEVHFKINFKSSKKKKVWNSFKKCLTLRERERERKCFSIRFQTILGNSMDTLLQKQITVYDTQTVCFVKLIPEFQTEHYSFAFFHVFLGIFILFYFGRNFYQFFSSVDNFHVPFCGFKQK